MRLTTKWLLLIFMFILTLGSVISYFVIQNSDDVIFYSMPDESMLPTIKSGQSVQSEDLGVSSLQPGDVIVFKDPRSQGYTLIRRLIALGGDQVVLKNGLIEVKLKDGGRYQPPSYLDPFSTDKSVTLKQGQMYVMGDNLAEAASLDSRNGLGLVPLGNYLGTIK